MKCMSCNAEIPPEWVACIQENKCPGCGGAIMDDSSKQLLDELREAMQRMPGDPEGLAGWLLSNYQLIKIGSAEPTVFHRKKDELEKPAQVEKTTTPVHLVKKEPIKTDEGEILDTESVSAFFKLATSKDLETEKANLLQKKKLGGSSFNLEDVAQDICEEAEVVESPPSVVRHAAESYDDGEEYDEVSESSNSNMRTDIGSYLESINNMGYNPVLEKERLKRLRKAGSLDSGKEGKFKIRRAE